MKLRERNRNKKDVIAATCGITPNVEGRLEMFMDMLIGPCVPENETRVDFELAWAQYEAGKLVEAEAEVRRMMLTAPLQNQPPPPGLIKP